MSGGYDGEVSIREGESTPGVGEDMSAESLSHRSGINKREERQKERKVCGRFLEIASLTPSSAVTFLINQRIFRQPWWLDIAYVAG